MSGLVLGLWMAVLIEGAGSCPAAGEIERKLIPLLPPGFVTNSGDRAVIVEDADGLTVSLARPDGRTAARRHLPRSGTCVDQAETVAVTLAVWEAQIHPEISLRLDRLAGAPTLTAQPVDREVTLVRSAAPVAARTLMPAVGAGIVGSWQPDSAVPGGRVDATLGASDRRLRLRLSLAGLGAHTLKVAPGQASWWRAYLVLGGDYVVPVGGRWRLALGAGGVVGLLSASGSGFSTDRSTRSVDLGAEVMLRVELALGSFRPWLGAALLTWLRRQTVEVTGEAASAALPRLEPLIALGADFCWRR